MGVKGEITWKTRDADGVGREVNVRKAGGSWRFYVREKRFEHWELLDPVPLEDWMRLLDAVRRRVGRRVLRPEEETRLRRRIAELFPDAEA
jgi:hypothetical protein